MEGGQVRGDIHIANYASKSPKGDIKSFLFGLAAEEPDSIGLSISFVPAEFKERKKGGLTMPPLGRVKKVLGVDFVGEPAANPGGLLSSKQDNNGGTTMLELSKKLRKFLTSRGLAVDSQSDEEICNELGITEENLSNWESKAENVDLGDGGEPEPEPEPEPEDLVLAMMILIRKIWPDRLFEMNVSDVMRYVTCRKNIILARRGLIRWSIVMHLWQLPIIQPWRCWQPGTLLLKV